MKKIAVKIIFLTTLLLFVSFVVIKTSFSYEQIILPIIISAKSALPQGYSVNLIFNHRELVEKYHLNANGEDLKIYFDPSAEFSGQEYQIDRVLDLNSAWNQSSTSIWFKTCGEITENSIDLTHYRIYLKDNREGLLQEIKNVFYYFTDFNEADLSEWIIDVGGWSIQNGVLKSESNGAEIRNKNIRLRDFLIETKIHSVNPYQYLGILGRYQDSNHFYLFDRDGNASDWRLYSYEHSWNLIKSDMQVFPAPKPSDILQFKAAGEYLTGILNGQIVFWEKTTGLQEGEEVGLFSNGADSATEFSYFLVRKAVENEPGVEISVNTVTPDVQILSPTPTYTPSPTNMPTPTATLFPSSTPTPTPIPVANLPAMDSAFTYDFDQNGKIDQIIIQFSGDLNGSTVTNSDFTVSSYLLGSEKPQEINGKVTLKIMEGIYYDTGSTPEIILRENGVKDLLGNWNVHQIIKTADGTRPFTIINHPNTPFHFNQGFEISGISSDFSSEEDGIVLNVLLEYKKDTDSDWKKIITLNNDEFVEPFEWNFKKWTPPTDGIYDLRVSSKDYYENTKESFIRSVVYDTRPPLSPLIRSNTHETNTWSSNNSISFSVDRLEAEDVKEYEYYLSGDVKPLPVQKLNGAGVVVNNLPDSKQIFVHFYALDFAGNRSEETILGPYKIDHEAPLINLIEPLESTISGIFSLQATASDNNFLENLTYLIYDQEKKLIREYKVFSGQLINVDTVGFVDLGVYQIVVQASDSAGNLSRLSKNFDIGPKIFNVEFDQSNKDINIYWNTSHPATSQIIYDLIPHPEINLLNYTLYAFSSVNNKGIKTKNHHIKLENLPAGKTYYYRVLSGGSPITISNEYVFTVVDDQNMEVQNSTINNYFYATPSSLSINEQEKDYGAQILESIFQNKENNFQLPVLNPQVLGTAVDVTPAIQPYTEKLWLNNKNILYLAGMGFLVILCTIIVLFIAM